MMALLISDCGRRISGDGGRGGMTQTMSLVSVLHLWPPESQFARSEGYAAALAPRSRDEAAMTLKRVVGFVATLAGGLLLALVPLVVVLFFYYRPTIEYGYVEGHPRAAPSWLTGELIGWLLGGVLGITGGVLLWAGRRRRRA